MPKYMEAYTEFVSSLREVRVLLDSAEASAKPHKKEPEQYNVYVKSAILFLAGKFEHFIESIVEEYIIEVNLMKLASSAIPAHLRLYHSFNKLKEFESLKAPQKHEKTRKIFEDLGALWAGNEAFASLDIECKFAYGRHGESELKKLFNIVGIEDVFESVRVMILDESCAPGDIPAAVKIDFKGDLNSVVHIRNNILHQDASPSTTPGDIRRYMAGFEAFARELSLLLRSNLDQLVGDGPEYQHHTASQTGGAQVNHGSVLYQE